MSDEAERVQQRRVSAHFRRFPEHLREPIKRFALDSRARSDLAVVFPGAAVSLVARYCGAEAARRALALLDAERPLKEVAQTIGIPMWMRKLPPEAFALPFGRLPDDEDFSRRITSYLPRSRAVAAAWLAAVSYG
ncbi:MAG TPA: hypothetical protein PK264_05065, partial [Hyphomicrobiaceae bacterium]|nr:hypothetical protein [Hyphomicrobiaceae bacterium]